MSDERKTLEQRATMTDIERLRHSASHVLATAILKLWPEAQFAAGPPVENGFYYDVDLPHRISPEDFEKIAAVSERPEPSKYKIDIIENIPRDEKISLYRSGDFIDLCAGPHVMRTGNIGAFKLTNVASAYYKGDEKNPQLQRIYGTAFKTKKELDDYLAMLEEAKKRDHRKLGKELEIFVFDDDVGPGLPMFLPRGAVIAEELEKLAKETEFAAGYQRVRTPHIARESLYKKSGHLPYYSESMFPPMELQAEGSLQVRITEDRATRRGQSQELAEKMGLTVASLKDTSTPEALLSHLRDVIESQPADNKERLRQIGDNEVITRLATALMPEADRYYLKAMNCPHHHKLFAAIPRSY